MNSEPSKMDKMEELKKMLNHFIKQKGATMMETLPMYDKETLVALSNEELKELSNKAWEYMKLCDAVIEYKKF